MLFYYDVNIDNIITALDNDDWLSNQPDWLRKVVEERVKEIKTRGFRGKLIKYSAAVVAAGGVGCSLWNWLNKDT